MSNEPLKSTRLERSFIFYGFICVISEWIKGYFVGVHVADG